LPKLAEGEFLMKVTKTGPVLYMKNLPQKYPPGYNPSKGSLKEQQPSNSFGPAYIVDIPSIRSK
jgi:hypothetical protein